MALRAAYRIGISPWGGRFRDFFLVEKGALHDGTNVTRRYQVCMKVAGTLELWISFHSHQQRWFGEYLGAICHSLPPHMIAL